MATFLCRRRCLGWALARLGYRLLVPAAALLQGVLAPATAAAAGALAVVGGGVPGQLCRAAIVSAEQNFAIPTGLLSAIGQVESGRRDPLTGAYLPWPWTVDADGDGHFYPNKQAAIAAVEGFQATGIRSIDVGCMQVNLLHHPHAFTSLEQAFDPASNAAYAASFLSELHSETGSWPMAAAFYHSTTPALATAYERQVMAAWPANLREAAGVPAFVAVNGAVNGLTSPKMLAARAFPPIPVTSGPFAGHVGAFMLSNRPVIGDTPPRSGGFVRHGLGWYRSVPVLIASGTSALRR